MSDTLDVLLDGRVAAAVVRDRGRLELTCTAEHLRASDPTPLSVSMPVPVPVPVPVPETTFTHPTVEPWLDGLLPDDPAARRGRAQRYGVCDTPFALLTTPVGEECAGAARFVTEERVEPMLAGRGAVEWLTDAQVGARLRDLVADSSAWLGEDFSGRFSLAGAQAKTALVHDPDGNRWGLPRGAAATSAACSARCCLPARRRRACCACSTP